MNLIKCESVQFHSLLRQQILFQLMLFKHVKIVFSQIQQLEGEMRPLKVDIQSLTTQKDAMLAEKTALKNEVLYNSFTVCSGA